MLLRTNPVLLTMCSGYNISVYYLGVDIVVLSLTDYLPPRVCWHWEGGNCIMFPNKLSIMIDIHGLCVCNLPII